MIEKCLKLFISLFTLLFFNMPSLVFAVDASDGDFFDGGKGERKIPVANYLAQIDTKFDALPNAAERQKFLSTPTVFSYWRLLDNDTLYLNHVGCNHKPRNLNPLAIAVSAGDVSLAKKFLSVVDNPNDTIWWSEGTAQIYTIAHHALDPRFKTENTSLQSRLGMIDLIAEKGVDFTIMSGKGSRSNPAISAGMLTRHSSIERVDDDYTEEMLLQARSLLYGADLTQLGTSYSPFGTEGVKQELLYHKAYQYYTMLQDAASKHLRPHTTTEEAFKKLSAEN